MEQHSPSTFAGRTGGLSPADRALLDAFLAGAVSAAEFDHEAHVHAAWALIKTTPLVDALSAFSRGVRALAARHGKPGLYHETITWTYLLLIHERVRALPDAAWPEFARASPDLLAWPSPLLRRYYSDERLWSDDARRSFLWPDRCDPPSGQEARPSP